MPRRSSQNPGPGGPALHFRENSNGGSGEKHSGPDTLLPTGAEGSCGGLELRSDSGAIDLVILKGAVICKRDS
jgi:hypothetical protein